VLSYGSFLTLGVPALGLLVGILGALYAGQRKDNRWAIALTILAVLVIGLLVIGFLVFIVFAFSHDPTSVAIGNTAVDIGLLYPIVVLVAALVYALRAGSQSGKE
jgi:heme/copper-type cytochrome/quinol oxidase subunit 2